MSETNPIDQGKFESQTILLVEDNDDDIFMMQRSFKKGGVRNPLQVVKDGEQAIFYLQGKGRYSEREKFPLPILLLLDLNMPKKGGLEVLEWVRQNPKFKRLMIYVLTSSTRNIDVARAFDLGANAYIVKPSRLESLTRLVQAWHEFGRFQIFPV